MKVITILLFLSIFIVSGYAHRINFSILAHFKRGHHFKLRKPSFPMWRPAVTGAPRPHQTNREAWPPHPGKDATENDYPINVDKQLEEENAEASKVAATATTAEEGVSNSEKVPEDAPENAQEETSENAQEKVPSDETAEGGENSEIVNYMEEVSRDANDKLKFQKDQDSINSKKETTASNESNPQESSTIDEKSPTDQKKHLDRALPIEKAFTPSEEWKNEIRAYLKERSRDIADELDVDQPLPEKRTSLATSDNERDLDRPLPSEEATMPIEKWQDERYMKERSRDIADELDVDEPLPAQETSLTPAGWQDEKYMKERSKVIADELDADERKSVAPTDEEWNPLQKMYMDELSKDINNKEEISPEQEILSSKEIAPQAEDLTVEKVWPPRSIHELKMYLFQKKHEDSNKPKEN